MKLDKLVKQLRRDVLANPKKAAVLGLMLLVATYFWAPLVGKWLFPSNGKKAAAPGQTALILDDDPAEPASQTKAGKARPFHWEKIRRLMSSDRLMTPATLEASWPDPFLVRASQQAPALPTEIERTRDIEEHPPTEFTPATAGLSLASVVIGSRRRTATINGETYREGALIPIGGKEPSKSPPAEFRLMRIERQGVQLEHRGKTWWLQFDQPKMAQGDEIQPTSNTARQ